MKQLALDLGIIGVGSGVPIQLAPELQEQLVVLMAEALLALVVDDPQREARAEREEDGDE
jgi:hypothetical protein